MVHQKFCRIPRAVWIFAFALFELFTIAAFFYLFSDIQWVYSETENIVYYKRDFYHALNDTDNACYEKYSEFFIAKTMHKTFEKLYKGEISILILGSNGDPIKLCGNFAPGALIFIGLLTPL